MLAKMELKPEAVAGVTRADLTERELQILEDWVSPLQLHKGSMCAITIATGHLQVNKLKVKYTVVGRLAST